MQNDIEHVIFDWNGTLIDDIAVAVDSVNDILVHQSLPAIDAATYRTHFGFPIQAFYERLGVDMKAMAFDALIERYLSRFNEGIKSCALHAGAMEFIALARPAGMSVSILSASQHDTLQRNVQHAGLAAHADHVFGLAGTEALGKIDLARRLDEALGHPGRRALMIGDTDHDIDVANACGWRAASVSSGHQSEMRLLSLHDAVFHDLDTLFTHYFPHWSDR